MNVEKFCEQIEDMYYKYFPNSFCIVKFCDDEVKNIDVSCKLAGDESEVENGIWEYDILKIRFFIFIPGMADIEDDLDKYTLNLEKWHSYYSLKPDKYYMNYGSRDLRLQKVSGNTEEILITLDKYFNKLYESLLNDLNKGLIHDNHVDLVKQKLV